MTRDREDFDPGGLPSLWLLRRRFRRAHLVGVAGAGMAALAEILACGGIAVSGTDPKRGRTAEHLRSIGVRLRHRHDGRFVPPGSLVVHTAAVPPDHPELRAARARGQLVLARGELLAELMAGACSVAVAGAHGKSTTAGMCAFILEEAGMKPWAAIGARLPSREGNALCGGSPLFVAEVDESDGTIDRVSPQVAVVSNVDREHLDRYGTFAALKAAFHAFAGKVGSGGAVVASADDAGACAVTRGVRGRRLLAGMAPAADVGCRDLELVRGCARFRLAYRGHTVARLRLGVPGLMNARNASLAAAAALALGATGPHVRAALSAFTGMGRRFERRGTYRGVAVVDDYAHHPREIEATLAAARAVFPGRRLIALFEPHRPSRLRALLPDFASALLAADQVVLAPLYDAFERGRGAGALDLARLMARRGRVATCAASPCDAVALACEACRRGDVLLVMGAGEAERMADLAAAELGGA